MILNTIRQSPDHSSISSKNFRISHESPSSISLIYMMNSNGPRPELWRTPLMTYAQSHHCTRTTTRCVQSLRYDMIQLTICGPIPWVLILRSSLWCGTLPNALQKSKYTTSTGYPSYRCFVTISMNFRFVKQNLFWKKIIINKIKIKNLCWVPFIRSCFKIPSQIMDFIEI